MVSWENIAEAIAANSHNSSVVPAFRIKSEPNIDRFHFKSNIHENEHVIKPVVEPVKEAKTQISANANSNANATKTKASKSEIDPLCIDLADTIELYDGSSNAGRKQLECTEAIRIEQTLNELYKSQSGRSRGWTKIGLESLIQARCASGGDIKELDKSKKAFAWQLVADDKVYSSFLDFICLAKNIRIAVWFEEEKHVFVFPAADKIPISGTEPMLYNINNRGHILMNGLKNGEDLIRYCDSQQWILMPPSSIFHTLSTLTMTELTSIAEKCDIHDIQGSKKERVAKLATFKLRARLRGLP
jgi:hypothetical protein